ncbi:type II secretion system F family protein [Streptococcus sp. CSL7508-lung]|uniref:Type II secretion system F family protein n=2 Tax=Streptococcus zalophi TaxID=640031 RepID=A0A934UDZ8_9STRE|nr:competence type IV pilus assembly protein ComGB [Streptococcus zalophi]MBJ8350205.1 type II secretion system F family protein [Streptococcus zalophi]
MDISLRSKKKPKRLSLKQQKKIVQLFNNLYASGFTLSETITFLERSHMLKKPITNQMKAGLLSGLSLSHIFSSIGFSDNVVTQIALADSHGNVQKSLSKIDAYLENIILVKKKLIEVATYPMVLLGFMMLIMMGLKNYMLLDVENGNLATRIISQFPNVFFAVLLILIGLIIVGYGLSHRLGKMKLYRFLSRIPFLGGFIQCYLSALFAREWGNLIGQGIELSVVVKLMQEQKSLLFQEIGQELEKALLSGMTFHEKIASYPFFVKELSLIIEYGQIKSKLGLELEIYAQELWRLFFNKVTKATQLIQPIVFLFVAIVIVMIYAAMLLPIYQTLEV